MLNTALLTVAVAMVAVNDTVLDEALVTAHRGTSYTGSAPGHVVRSAELERRGAAQLHEALGTLAGVSVKDYGGMGGLKTVSIRSFGAQHTGVCYDGIVVSDCQNGQVDIGRFHLDDISRITVDVAGSDNIFRPARLLGYVGVVELESAGLNYTNAEANHTSAEANHTGDKANHTNAKANHTSAGSNHTSTGSNHTRTDAHSTEGSAGLQLGSYGTYRPSFTLRYKANDRSGVRWGVGGHGAFLSSRGDYPFTLHNGLVTTQEVRLNSQVRQWDGELRGQVDWPRGGRLALKAGFYDCSRGLPGSVVLYTQRPTEHLWDRTGSASALYTGTWGPWRLKAAIDYSNAANRYLDADELKPRPEDDRYRQQQAALSVVALREGQWHDGAHQWQVALAEDVDVAHLTSNLPEAVPHTRWRSFTALSARYRAPHLTTTASVLATPVGPKASASVAYGLGRREVVRLRASYKESCRMPTFNDLYYLRVGNRNLRPERARQLNVGAVLQAEARGPRRGASRTGVGWRGATLTADAYYNGVRDKIVAVPTMFIWHMRNVGRVRMAGLDATSSLAFAPARWFTGSVAAAYSLQHATDVTDRSAKNYGHQIPYTPRHSGSVVTTFVTPWLTAAYTLMAVGERFSLAQNTAAYRIAPYCDHTVSLSHNFALPRALRLHASLEGLNLGGHNYEVIKYYPMPGRHYRLSLRLDFGGARP